MSKTARSLCMFLTLLALTPFVTATSAQPLNSMPSRLPGDWTWVDGANTVKQKGTYGTEDVPAPTNVPGARSGGESWTGTDGSLWLFGGSGVASAPGAGRLNDLWKFNPATGQ